MAYEKISITLDGSTLESVEERRESAESRDRATAIGRSLDRYFEALRVARQSLRDNLSEAEISAVLDNLNGCWMAEPVSIRLLWANVADGMEEGGLAEKWKINGPALVTKLKAMSFIEACALVDASERWWNRVAREENPSFGEALLD